MKGWWCECAIVWVVADLVGSDDFVVAVRFRLSVMLDLGRTM
jgi:hypothetical protein